VKYSTGSLIVYSREYLMLQFTGEKEKGKKSGKTAALAINYA